MKTINTADEKLLCKYEKLKKIIASYGSLAVAFSGGTDSTLLLYAAAEVLKDNVIAVSVATLGVTDEEKLEAEAYCKQLGVEQIQTQVDVFKIDGFLNNPIDRCYLCKREILRNIKCIAEEHGIRYTAEGTNLDDEGDYRPGMRAIAELCVKSPLREVGLSKKEIRLISKYLELPTWNKPANACLFTRFAFGDVLSQEKIRMVEKAEELLKREGFGKVRVRVHGKLARIELEPEQFGKFMEASVRNKVYQEFKSLGFEYVTLDIKGYQTGSMNGGTNA